MALIEDSFDRPATACSAGATPGITDTGQGWINVDGGIAVSNNEARSCIFSLPGASQRNTTVVAFPVPVNDRRSTANVRTSSRIVGTTPRVNVGVVLGISNDEATFVIASLVGVPGGIDVVLQAVGIPGLGTTSAPSGLSPGDETQLSAKLLDEQIVVSLGSTNVITVPVTPAQSAAIQALQRVGLTFLSDMDDITYNNVVTDAFNRLAPGACPAGGLGVADTLQAWTVHTPLHSLAIENFALPALDGRVVTCSTSTTPALSAARITFGATERRVGADLILSPARSRVGFLMATNATITSLVEVWAEGSIQPRIHVQGSGLPNGFFEIHDAGFAAGETHRVEAQLIDTTITIYVDGDFLFAFEISAGDAAAIVALTEVGLTYRVDVDGPIADDGDSKIDDFQADEAILNAAGNDDDGQSRFLAFSADEVFTQPPAGSPLPTDIEEGDPDHIDHHNLIHDLLQRLAGAGFRATGTRRGPLSDRPPSALAPDEFYFNEDADVLQYSISSDWLDIGGAGGQPIKAQITPEQDFTLQPKFNAGNRQNWLDLRLLVPDDAADPTFAENGAGLAQYGLRLWVEFGGMQPLSLLNFGDTYPRVGFVSESIEFSHGNFRPPVVLELNQAGSVSGEQGSLMVTAAFNSGVVPSQLADDILVMNTIANVGGRTGDAFTIIENANLPNSKFAGFTTRGSLDLASVPHGPDWTLAGRLARDYRANPADAGRELILLGVDGAGFRGGIGWARAAVIVGEDKVVGPVLYAPAAGGVDFVFQDDASAGAVPAAISAFRVGAAAGGRGVVYIGNASLAPTANPDSGGVLYVVAGALFYRGSAGTITPLAVA